MYTLCNSMYILWISSDHLKYFTFYNNLDVLNAERTAIRSKYKEDNLWHRDQFSFNPSTAIIHT